MGYKHLTEANRTWFERLLQEGYPFAEMARLIGCHRSTLYREYRRNLGTRAAGDTYSSKAAQTRRDARSRQANSRPQIEPWVYLAAHDFLVTYDLSPARIADHLPISAEWVYRWMYREIAGGADWDRHFRSGRSARHTRRSRRLAAKTGVSAATPIQDRPDVCNLRLEFGHWEADLLLGRRDNTYAVLVVKERLSRLTLVSRVRGQRSYTVMRAMHRLLRPYQGQVKSITTDNGHEFYRHQAFATAMGCTMYRCDPHSPWQRGQVEGENKNLRQYMPKSFDADKLTTRLLKDAERKINMRPKLVLDNRSPLEVANELSGVALRY